MEILISGNKDEKTKGRDCHMVPLGLLRAGERAEVMQIREGNHWGTGSPAVQRTDRNNHLCRMEDMGLRVGKEIKMLNNEGRGAMLIKLDESRIAMGRGMAMKILVRRKG